MSLRRLFSSNRHSTTDQASDMPPTYRSSVEEPPLVVKESSAISSPLFSERPEVDSEIYDETVEADSISLGSSKTENTSNHGATKKYLYYRLYNKDCDMHSKASFDPEEPSLGRIRVDSIPPPHSPASIKRCIGRTESKPGLSFGDLYATRFSTTPMKERIISLLVQDYPGLTQDCPMALVQTLVRIQATRERMTYASGELSHKIGDIFFTDGVVKTNESSQFKIWYEATSPAGRKGLIAAEKFKFLDDI